MADDTTTSQEDLDAAEKEVHKACSEAQPVKTDDTFNWVVFETIAHMATHAMKIPTPLGIMASAMLEMSITVPDSEEGNKKAHCDYWKERLSDLTEQRDLESKVNMVQEEMGRKSAASSQLLQRKVDEVMNKVERRNLLDRILHPENAYAMTSPITAASVKKHKEDAVAELMRRLPTYGR